MTDLEQDSLRYQEAVEACLKAIDRIIQEKAERTEERTYLQAQVMHLLCQRVMFEAGLDVMKARILAGDAA